jgi:heme exporter protein A
LSDHTLLQCENLHVWRGERHVLKGVGFSLGRGECLLVRGPNGTGKTSLLRTVCGLMHPEEGRVLWRGQSTRLDLASFHSDLAYIGHETPLKADLSAAENLRYWVGVRRPADRGEVQRVLERVAGHEWADQPARTLSAGQKRRAALAGLLLMAVPLWVLDEPTTNLDADGQHLVGTLIAEQLSRGGLVVAAVHHELAVPAASLRQLELHRE